RPCRFDVVTEHQVPEHAIEEGVPAVDSNARENRWRRVGKRCEGQVSPTVDDKDVLIRSRNSLHSPPSLSRSTCLRMGAKLESGSSGSTRTSKPLVNR